MIPRTTVSPKGLHSQRSDRLSTIQDSTSCPSRAEAMRKKLAKGGGIVRWDLAPTRCPAHLCLPVSPSSPTFHSYYFPFPYPGPRRGGLPRLLYSLCLCAALYRVLSTRCQGTIYANFSTAKREKELDMYLKKPFIFNLEKGWVEINRFSLWTFLL